MNIQTIFYMCTVVLSVKSTMEADVNFLTTVLLDVSLFSQANFWKFCGSGKNSSEFK